MCQSRKILVRCRSGIIGFFYILVISMLFGCARPVSVPDPVSVGINPAYIFGDRRPGEDTYVIDDSNYIEYLEWKRWQDFQAYQKWRRLQREQVINDAPSD
jgi:hypothetical protein